MSALGQKQTYAVQNDVRFTPESGHSGSAKEMSAEGQKRDSFVKDPLCVRAGKPLSASEFEQHDCVSQEPHHTRAAHNRIDG